MKQQERQERSRREILEAAMEEFGAHNYEDVTMEGICSRHAISKGMMYHYYSNKDELFLLCVQAVLEQMKERIERDIPSLEGQETLERTRNYFLLREIFFREHPKLKNIFECAMLRTPKHLRESIQELRRPLRELNRAFFQNIISQLRLRPTVEAEEAARYFEGIESVFWELMAQYRSKEEIFDLHSFSLQAGRLLELVLFGIAQQ